MEDAIAAYNAYVAAMNKEAPKTGAPQVHERLERLLSGPARQ